MRRAINKEIWKGIVLGAQTFAKEQELEELRRYKIMLEQKLEATPNCAILTGWLTDTNKRIRILKGELCL